MKRIGIIVLICISAVIICSNCYAIEPDDSTDYMGLMFQAAISKDIEAGYIAEQNRNSKIDRLNLPNKKVSFDDLYYLAKIMDIEAGDCHQYDNGACPMGVGCVVLNRCASPEYEADTIKGILTQSGQYYYPSMARTFEQHAPRYEILSLALLLLEGERPLPPSVVFHMNSSYGSGWYTKYKHSNHNTLYFSISFNPSLYEDAVEGWYE